eukprot:TRINITY_DN30510_c0_g2_i1.p1 TRINITY_DN30510_c0_g2~~TRINITY_DN30510_c0_g2_i1.p1  ORF type:complete len:793 (+),score=148.64 TRINITY_DN30510_c0_g2_i1:72-2450(+)
MTFRRRGDWPPERAFKSAQARAVVPLPSLNLISGEMFYQQALSIVRQRRSLMEQGSLEEDSFQSSIVPAGPSYPSVQSLDPGPPRTPLCGTEGWGESVPKYLRLSCVMNRPAPQVRIGAPSPRRSRPTFSSRSPRVTEPMIAEAAVEREVPNLWVAEASLTVSLRTNAGEVRVPPYVWLVLGMTEESTASNLPVSRGRSAPDQSEAVFYAAAAEVNAQARALLSIATAAENPETFGSVGQASLSQCRAESKEAGDLPLDPDASGGQHAAVLERSVPLLRLVGEDRLTLTGAEANFQRCARGASLLALKHAAYILKVLVTRRVLEQSCGRQHLAEKEDVTDSSYTPPLTLEEVDAKVSRVAGMVASRAAAQSHRASLRAKPKATKPEASSEDIKQFAEAEARGCRQTVLQKGFLAALDFLSFATRKYGNPVRMWFALDPEEHMKIAEKQFARACEEIGFRGNIAALWRHLDRDGGGHISLIDVDSHSAIILADFKVLIESQFDGSVEKFMKSVASGGDRAVESKNSRRLVVEEFVQGFNKVCSNFQGSPKRLFDLLCRFNCGAISTKDLTFLYKWSPPLYLFSKGDQGGLDALREALEETHHNMLRAWFKAMDTDQTMRVPWTKFRTACASIPRTGRHAASLPKTEEEIAAVWRMLDEDCSGWIALREFDKPAFEAASRFKRWADHEHGSIAKFMNKLIMKNMIEPTDRPAYDQVGQKINRGVFRKALRDEVGFNREAAELLSEGLDVADAGLLGEHDVKFLDKWDLVWEEWESGAYLQEGAVAVTTSRYIKT